MEVCGPLLKQPPVTPANASRSVVYGESAHSAGALGSVFDSQPGCCCTGMVEPFVYV